MLQLTLINITPKYNCESSLFSTLISNLGIYKYKNYKCFYSDPIFFIPKTLLGPSQFTSIKSFLLNSNDL